MAKHIACNDVVAGCSFTAQAETESALIEKVAAHAAKDHGVKEVLLADLERHWPRGVRLTAWGSATAPYYEKANLIPARQRQPLTRLAFLAQELERTRAKVTGGVRTS